MSDEFYASLRPMIATNDKAALWLMSTPNGRQGFFYEEWIRPDSDWVRIEAPAARLIRLIRAPRTAGGPGNRSAAVPDGNGSYCLDAHVALCAQGARQVRVTSDAKDWRWGRCQTEKLKYLAHGLHP